MIRKICLMRNMISLSAKFSQLILYIKTLVFIKQMKRNSLGNVHNYSIFIFWIEMLEFILITMADDNISDQRTCRICLETDNQKKMIRPCKCIGSIAYVHSFCEEKWIEKSPFLIHHSSPSYIVC